MERRDYIDVVKQVHIISISGQAASNTHDNKIPSDSIISFPKTGKR